VNEVLIQVDAPHFCAGLVAKEGKVVIAAPILRYMIGWTGTQFQAYLKKKGWTYQRVGIHEQIV
jgi:hypothetical protein